MIVFAVILIAGFDFVQSEKCITPNATEGNCIPLQQCEKISKVIDMQMINPDIDTLNYLIHSQCGFNATDVNVCCPLDNGAEIIEENTLLRLSSNLHQKHPKWTKSNTKQCGLQRNLDGINKGILTTPYDHPWLALIQHKNETREEIICGGVLIGSEYVLTAANCVDGNFTENENLPFSVLLGEYNIKSKNECSTPSTTCAPPPVVVEVNKIILHPDYLSKTKNPNLAVLKLKKSPAFSEFVYPICLPDDDGLEYNNNFMYVAGWGQKEKHFNAVKMQSYVPVVKCPPFLLTKEENDLDNPYICTRSNYSTFYRSDFGGPLISFDENRGNTTGFLIGIADKEQNEKNNEKTVAYTKITPHLSWLKTIL